MGKEIKFSIGGSEYSAEPVKLDRKKLYGFREKIALDENGEECALVSMSECGTIVIPKGGTGLGVLSVDGKWIDRSQIKTVYLDGSPAKLIPSSYGRVIMLDKKASPEELLDCQVAAFYHLGAVPGLITAIGGDIYQFDYCYHDSYETAAAFLLVAENGGDKELFMLTGPKAEFSFTGYDEIAVIEDSDTDDEEDDGDEFDFSVF